jgi:hypothetical protein
MTTAILRAGQGDRAASARGNQPIIMGRRKRIAWPRIVSRSGGTSGTSIFKLLIAVAV